MRKNGQQKHATCFATLLQKELKSDVARFTTNVQTCQLPNLVQDRFDEGGKTLNVNVALQLVLQQCCKTSCMFLLSVFQYLN